MTTSNISRPPETRIVEMVFPNQANHYGTLFGGDALRLMDMAAFVAASRHARKPVVTASSERIDFHVPVRQGQLAEVVGRVSRTGRTSMTVEVELWAEDLLTGTRELCTKGSFVLVAVDQDGRPAPIQDSAAQ
jgi:acyl-CoA hydrolase